MAVRSALSACSPQHTQDYAESWLVQNYKITVDGGTPAQAEHRHWPCMCSLHMRACLPSSARQRGLARTRGSIFYGAQLQASKVQHTCRLQVLARQRLLRLLQGGLLTSAGVAHLLQPWRIARVARLVMSLKNNDASPPPQQGLLRMCLDTFFRQSQQETQTCRGC